MQTHTGSGYGYGYCILRNPAILHFLVLWTVDNTAHLLAEL